MRFFIILAISFSTLSVSAQSQTELDSVFNSVCNSYIQMSNAANDDNIELLKQINSEINRNFEINNFNSLRCVDDTLNSLNGHFVFSPVFVDSLVNGADAYKKSDALNFVGERGGYRGVSGSGTIKTVTRLVKAKSSSNFSFYSKGHQNLAVVAESGGLLTLKVHVTNSYGLDEWYSRRRSRRRRTD